MTDTPPGASPPRAEIPLDTPGRITAGPQKGHWALVRDDTARTGGFLVLSSAAPDVLSAAEVFDGWVETRADLAAFFAESGWEVEWGAPR